MEDGGWGWGKKWSLPLPEVVIFPYQGLVQEGPDQPVAPSLTAGAGQQCRHLFWLPAMTILFPQR